MTVVSTGVQRARSRGALQHQHASMIAVGRRPLPEEQRHPDAGVDVGVGVSRLPLGSPLFLQSRYTLGPYELAWAPLPTKPGVVEVVDGRLWAGSRWEEFLGILGRAIKKAVVTDKRRYFQYAVRSTQRLKVEMLLPEHLKGGPVNGPVV